MIIQYMSLLWLLQPPLFSYLLPKHANLDASLNPDITGICPPLPRGLTACGVLHQDTEPKIWAIYLLIHPPGNYIVDWANSVFAFLCGHHITFRVLVVTSADGWGIVWSIIDPSGYCALMQPCHISQKTEGPGTWHHEKSIIHFLPDGKAFEHIVKLKTETET